MRRLIRTSAVSALLGMLVSGFIVVSATTANAAESVPTLKWSPAPTIGANVDDMYTSPTGGVTLGCTTTNGGSNLMSYNNTGSLVLNINRTDIIDGVVNCISNPIVDKTGTVYGVPSGSTPGGGWGISPNLLAYGANGLKWKYPAHCDNNGAPKMAVGADGNIYVATYGHLIGLKTELEAGQTQPTKVLDVTIPYDCSSFLQAYKDGLVLHGQSSGNARYYSYGGKFLGQATIGDVWYEKLNADGKLFVGGYIAGSYTSGKVTMYDPRTGQIAWTTIASTPGANVNGIQVYPVSGGGVVAKINEQKMVSGFPATPTEYVTTLAILNASGIVTKSMQLGNTYSQSGVTGTYAPGATYPIAAGQGKLAVVRMMYLSTGISYPQTVSAIAIGVYDIAGDVWSYGQVMSGDLAKAGGPSGYYLNSMRFGVTNNTLYLNAKCSGNCSVYTPKLFALDIGELSMDYPRGDVLLANTPAQPAPVSYVALGDSYSSGQGAGVYDDGTVTSTNKCYKSANAYGRSLNRDPYVAFALSNFAACGGSVTTDIYQTSTYSGVPKQDSVLSSSTGVVTITIGGNDIGFADVIKTCADPTKDCDGAFNSANSMIGAIFDNKLQTTYLDILQKAPAAKIYVLGYPPILAAGSSGCLVGNNGSSLPFFSADRVQKGVVLLGRLNLAIQTNINTIRSLGANYQRLYYLDASATSSPFTGNDVCSSTPAVNGLILSPDDTPESFHPNVRGQQARMPRWSRVERCK